MVAMSRWHRDGRGQCGRLAVMCITRWRRRRRRRCLRRLRPTNDHPSAHELWGGGMGWLNQYLWLLKQASKQASKQAALADCGTRGCKIVRASSNCCTAAVYGSNNRDATFYTDGGETIRAAQQKALSSCQAKYSSCQIALSECSLAGDIQGR